MVAGCAIAIDTECTGVDFHRGDLPYCVSACDSNGNTFVWNFEVDPFTRNVEHSATTVQKIQDKIDSYDWVVFHNSKFDIHALNAIGVFVPPEKIQDTLLLSHLFNNRESHKLKDLAYKYLDFSKEDEEALLACIASARRVAKKHNWKIIKAENKDLEGESWMKADGWVPAQLIKAGLADDEEWGHALSRYALCDVERTMGLWIAFCQEDDLLEHYGRQLKLIPVLVGMEDRGVSLRLKVLNDRVNHYKERSDELLGIMRDMVANPEFNPGSPKQLQEVLFNTLGFPVIKTGKTGPSTDKHVLKYLYQSHKHTFLDKLLAFRKCMTTANYLVSYQEKQHNGRLHSSFNPIGTDTTRLSSSNPNLQNAAKAVDVDPSKQDMEVSKDTYNIREVFGPAEGRVWLDADYSQLQLRIFAFVSGETRLIDAFEEGWDAHDFVACQVYKTDNPTKQQRTVAKGINFGFIFGAGENKLTALSGDPSIWQTVNRLFPNAVNYLERTSKQVSRDGYVDVAGYRLHVPIDPRNGMPKGYTGVCYKVQGLEGLIVKRAMVYWDEYLQNICRLTKSHNHAFLTLQVHDELIADFVSLPRKNLVQHGNNLKRLMEKAGRDYGVATPAEMSLVTKSWDCSEELRE